jgi:NADH dehydrogenase
MRRIAVLGAGFGGFHATQALEKALAGRRRVELTVVADDPRFVFTPLLPNVANGELDLSAITFPLHEQLGEHTRLVRDRVEEVDMERRVLRGREHEVPFDYLLLAPGADVHWYDHADWSEHAITCKSAADAVHIRAHVEEALARAGAMTDPEARARALTFVFAGGGPTGVELLAELRASIEQGVLRAKDAPVRFILIEPRDTILYGLPESLQELASAHLERVGVELRLGRSVVGRDAHTVTLDDGEEIACDTLFWCAGIKAPDFLGGSGLPLLDDGRLDVDSSLQLAGVEGVFACGDACATPEDVPQTAQVATQQGPHAANNLIASLSGRALSPWRYAYQGDLITLGRPQAAVSIKGVAFQGRPAYALYRLAYASLMPGALKKLRIITDWLETDAAVNRARPGTELLEGTR